MQKQKKNSENELGIDLTRTYSPDEVLKLLNIVFEEADKSIEDAYKKGYKQAVVEYAPQVEYWKTLFEENKKIKREQMFITSAIGFCLGFATGGAGGLYFGINLN